ncbi:hypothetical protein QNI19_30135 [Cytophagaceae bacterium DM2B3-1]|uniref:Uncharacterized protein n=1 Tax=Xanthocytophaga flava TaxID=3048013 RepID=A0ABT7CTY9_9BACT|nr:hypothetical protein [Xanthocytophaga flavus]MDJ1472537.1 hypothetical protein [Xanthocytophaga flavus]MDJ1497236.1 hypothetical protein [Xanthocytophaga flavus]
MTIQQVETNIVSKVIKHYNEFDIAKVIISKYEFSEITSFSFQTFYYHNNKQITLNENAPIGEEINLLLKLLFEKKQQNNKGIITIYPDGRYESEFIWDQQAHIDFLLLDMATAFSFIYSESDIKITDLMIPEQEWEKAVITILFVNGHILPLQIEVTTEQGIKQFSVPVQNLSYQEAPYLIKSFEDIYQLANEGELKQHFAPGWNTVIIYQDRQDRFNFEEHVHFELRDLS